ncbi:MAG TPA: ABC transporter substrate-binding protein [Micromonospora sp.]
MHVPCGSRSLALTVCAALLLTTVGCGSNEDAEELAMPMAVRLYGTDGNMGNTFGDAFKDQPGILNGMKGTTPLTPLPAEFKRRLLEVNPKLTATEYAAEAYDAVVISALAAELAGTTEPKEIAAQINGVTAGGTSCDTVAACLELARAGKDLQYRGVSLQRGGFTDAGEPATATYATLHFDSNNRINHRRTEFVGAGDESATTTLAPPQGRRHASGVTASEPLRLGGLLPKSGGLASRYPAMAAGVMLAVREINEAGGVLGQDVQWIDGDDGTSVEVARRTVRSLLAKKVHVIIGAGTSGVSRAILPDIITAGVVLFSPSDTDAGLSTIEDNGLYFRTAPSDVLQGRALANVVLRDGPDKVALVARKDTYGKELQTAVSAELEKAGLGSDQILLLTYEPPADAKSSIDFTAGAEEIKKFGADAVVLIGYLESADVIKALLQIGVQLRY